MRRIDLTWLRTVASETAAATAIAHRPARRQFLRHGELGELLREPTLDPERDYQPTGPPKGPTRTPPEMTNRPNQCGFDPS